MLGKRRLRKTWVDIRNLILLTIDLQEEVVRVALVEHNLTIRRLIDRVVINANGTFTIQPDERSEWHFDADGTLLEGSWS